MDWVWVESPGTELSEEPRIKSSKFGDGYEQRTPDGLNPIVQSWALAFNDVDEQVANDMLDFLRAAVGAAAFSYWPLWSPGAIRVICRRWQRTLGSVVGQSSISATFEEVFEP